MVYNQLQTDSNKTELSTSTKKSKDTKNDANSTTQSQTSITTDFADGGNNITLSNTNGKVEVTFTLTGMRKVGFQQLTLLMENLEQL